MPRVKQTETEEKNRKARACIAKGMAMQDVNDEEVAKKLNVTKRTFQNKKKHPETFTLGELRKLSVVLKLTEEDRLMLV